MPEPMKILFLTPYPYNKAPSQRLKFEQYYSYFEKEGYQVHKAAFVSNSFWVIIYKKGHYFKKAFYSIAGYLRRIGILFSVPKYDVVYIHLWVTPFGPPIFEWLVTKLAKKVIYDIDDLIYLSYEKGLLKLLKGKTKPLYLIRHADHVITCTPFLDEFVKKYNSNTTDISSTINSDTYQPVNKYDNSKKLVIGWSGSHSTSRFLYLLTDVLKEVYQEYPFKLLVMGDKNFNIEGLETEAVEWTDAIEISTLQKMDIGLYPLPLNDKWVLGKSGLKALQYMMLGLPVVATAIGANFRVIENNVSGFLVTTSEEWKEKLLLLLKDAELRKKIGTEARKKAEAEFSIKATAPVYLSIFNKVVS